MRASHVVGLVVILGAALAVGGAWRQFELLREQAAKSQAHLARAQAAEAALAAQQQHRALGEQVARRLAATEAALARATRDRQLALAGQAGAGPCLGAGALRVLDGAPGLRVAGLPGATRSADAADAAAAADPDAAGAATVTATATGPSAVGPGLTLATEQQVAGWMLQAGGLYEQCRARLDDLIDFTRRAAAAAHPQPIAIGPTTP